MRAISANTADWSKDKVHAEYFGASQPSEQLAPTNQLGATFEVMIASSRQRLEVPIDQSILQVLRKNGLDVLSSCEAGVCGTCRVHFLEGIPDHRDLILQDEEKTRELLVCCSRSLTPLLVLDL
jgi:vanillate O-demethylase ferredoxin subunit